MESKNKMSPMVFNIRRFLNFVKLFLRNRRATFGLAIILMFALVAIGAPLFTPYDSLGQDPSRSGALAAKRVAPSWLRSFPAVLWGDPTLSENFEPLSNPSLPKLVSEGGMFNFSVAAVEQNVGVTAQSVSDVNYPYIVNGFNFPNQNGSMAITFQRPQGNVTGESKAYLYTDIDYPYSGPPAKYVANFELLTNGSYYEKVNPSEQWYILELAAPKRNDITGGNVSILVSTSSDLYVAVTTDITDYFVNKAKTWAPQGYGNWKEWLNGTSTLPSHWDQMNWIVSEGSLTNKTYEQVENSTYASMYTDSGNVSYTGFRGNLEICDPDLTRSNDKPDIVKISNWTLGQTRLTNGSRAGSTRLYTNPVTDWPLSTFIEFPYFTIGSGENEEVGQLRTYGPAGSSIELQKPLKYDHAANETVEIRAKRLPIMENLNLIRSTKMYFLVKLLIDDPYEIYRLEAKQDWPLQITPTGNKTIGGVLATYDEGFKSLSLWKAVVRETMLTVPVKVRVFLGSAEQSMESMTTLFPAHGLVVPTGFYVDALTGEIGIRRPLSGLAENQNWILSRTSTAADVSIIEREQQAVLQRLFPTTPGRYRFGIELTFLDTNYKDQNVSTTVYVDDLTAKLYGTSFGLLGSDQYGRDLWSQLVYGSRISLYLGLLVSIISIAIGLFVGLMAGYMGGAADQFLMRFNDLLLVLPGLPLMIVLVAVLGTRMENLIILLGFLGWNGFARLVRSQVLSLKERPFIEAAKAAGAGTGHIVIRHIVPHVMALVYVSLATSVPGAITAEAALSWLGFYDPTRMSWGRMLHEVFAAGATRNWWWVIPPGLCISLVAVAFILLGFALDDILNPKLRMRK